jgi:DNA-directed RNA polymerase specialized sigma24 family protein
LDDREFLKVSNFCGHIGPVDERKGQVVELRFLGRLSVEERAEVLKVSPETVKRGCKLAKVLLLEEMTGERGNGR